MDTVEVTVTLPHGNQTRQTWFVKEADDNHIYAGPSKRSIRKFRKKDGKCLDGDVPKGFTYAIAAR